MVRAKVPVDPDEYDMLNERFYRMSPARYLRARLGALLITVGDADIGDVWKRGVTYGSVRATADGPMDDDETVERHTQEFAAIESTMLLHHACETLLQLYLAHEFRTKCPWLALSEATDAREFKNRLRQLEAELVQADRLRDLVEVFTFTSDRSQTNVPEEDWSDNEAALAMLFHEAIKVVLHQAKAYNAAKHGLALGAGEAGVALGATLDSPIIDHNGPALSYLELAGTPEDRYWQTTTRWVEPERAIAATTVVAIHIERLWQVASFRRHHGSPPDRIRLSRVEEIDLAFGLGKEPGVYVETMSFRLRGGVRSSL